MCQRPWAQKGAISEADGLGRGPKGGRRGVQENTQGPGKSLPLDKVGVEEALSLSILLESPFLNLICISTELMQRTPTSVAFALPESNHWGRSPLRRGGPWEEMSSGVGVGVVFRNACLGERLSSKDVTCVRS